jgi:hypothetical protein
VRSTDLGTRLLATFGAAPALRVQTDATGEVASAWRLGADGWSDASGGARLVHQPDGHVTVYLPDRDPVRIRTRTRASMLRSVPGRTYLHSTLGVGLVEGEPLGACFYERWRPL